jgi:hypothetical protein
MRDYLELDTVPTEEDCTYVNQPNYYARARREAHAYINQILRYYPAPDYGDLGIKRNAHDFGEYLSVKIIFDDTDEESCNWAYTVEADPLGVLREWDATARAELGLQTA